MIKIKIKKTDLNEKYVKQFIEASEEVIKKISKCHKWKRKTIVLELKKERMETAAEIIFSEKDVNIDFYSPAIQRAIKKNHLKGMLAHEFGHLVLKESGKDSALNKKMVSAIEVNEKKAKKLMRTRRQVENVRSLLLNFSQIIKDIQTNLFIIKCGLGQELYEYYKSTIKTKNKKFKTRGMNKTEKTDLLLTILSLSPMWVPFEKLEHRYESRAARINIKKHFSEIPVKFKEKTEPILLDLVDYSLNNKKNLGELFNNVLDVYFQLVEKTDD